MVLSSKLFLFASTLLKMLIKAKNDKILLEYYLLEWGFKNLRDSYAWKVSCVYNWYFIYMICFHKIGWTYFFQFHILPYM